MPDSTHLNERSWDQAEALIARVEQASREASQSPEKFFDDLAGGLRLASNATACSVWVVDRETRTMLAASGLAVRQEPSQTLLDAARENAVVSSWNDDSGQSPDRLVTAEHIGAGAVLGVELRLDQPVDFASRRHLSDLTQVLVELSAKVFLRSRWEALRDRANARQDRDAVVGRLYQGVGLQESFTNIACVIAAEAAVDRVSLLRQVGNRWRLVATSSQAIIDRRARQVRFLEAMVKDVLQTQDRYALVVGDVDQASQGFNQVDQYLQESGCRELFVEGVSGEGAALPCTTPPQITPPRAAIVVERFRRAGEHEPRIDQAFDAWRQPIAAAVATAMERDEGGWGLVANRVASREFRRPFAIAAAAGCFVVLLAVCVPATLSVPCNGRVVSTDRAAVYAPDQGIVAEVAVTNGQHVVKDQALVVLQSPKLQIQKQKVQGALAATRARLAAVIATRTRGNRAADRSNQATSSTDEKVLRTELNGLEGQLDLIDQQEAALTIRSPVDGHVNRWDLERSLDARPVSHGQHLLDVVATTSGWTAELDVPEQNIHYLLETPSPHDCVCTIRLRSNPTVEFRGTVQSIDDVAQLTPTGQSVIRVTSTIEPESNQQFRGGATVLAQIDCGERSIGFVWLRGLIEWSRRQTWL